MTENTADPTNPQNATLSQLRDWGVARQAGVASAQSWPGSRDMLRAQEERREHVMNYDPSRRLEAARDTLDEVLGWNYGRGHLIVTGPGLPTHTLDTLAQLGFAPVEIETAVAERIDAAGNLTTADIVAATADLTGVPGTQDAFLQDTHERATSPEALRYAEEGAYQDEWERVSALPLADLLAEAGHSDLPTALQDAAERHGYATYDDLDAVLSGKWNDTSKQLHHDMSNTDAALWVAADTTADTGDEATGLGGSWQNDDVDDL